MKTTEQIRPSEENIPCFECETGSLLPVPRDFKVEVRVGELINIPDVPMLVCNQCGDGVTGEEGNAYINAYLDKALDAIAPEEVRQLLSKYNLTQREAARITGFGEKNISRWASGRARPSEAVSNFLRLLLADAMAFERLKHKNFSATSLPVATPQQERDPNAKEFLAASRH